MCCASLGFLLTLTPWLALGRDTPPTSLSACAGSPAVWITGLCWHVIAAARPVEDLAFREKPGVDSRDSLRKNTGRARPLADFSTVLSVCCMISIVSDSLPTR